MQMQKPIHFKFTLSQIEEWMIRSLNFPLSKSSSLEWYLKMAEDFPPMRLQRILRPLVVDEDVDFDDLTFTIVDENTGIEHPYNPVPSLRECFRSVKKGRSSSGLFTPDFP